MKMIIRSLLIVLMGFAVSVGAQAAPSPQGVWQTYDLDKVARSHVQMYVANGRLYGKVVKILPNKGQKSTDRCTKCKGANKNKPKMGIVVIYGHTLKDGKWVGGRVLDTDTGKSYRCIITISPDNRTLSLHAYVALPALGKTVKWKRVR